MRPYGWLCLLALLPGPAAAAEPPVTIRTDFPGGNALVHANDGDTVRLAPDLRGGPAWFYWHFEAEAQRPGTVTFALTKPPLIGVRGPAVSTDDGLTWRWLGTERVQLAPPASKDKTAKREDCFSYEFIAAKQKVRFASVMPYLLRDLERFLARHTENKHLTRSVLTHTRKGRRPVPLLRVGEPGPGRQAVLFTARHHACESMASYLLEGILREAMSDGPPGKAFREKYVLYAVPMVDLDGVEAGDQGKNRPPHDHNRDYGPKPIYPEVQAIQELGERENVHLSLDLHCPFLRGDIHEAFYFDGLALPHITANLLELNARLKEERPRNVMVPVNFMKKPGRKFPGGIPNSYHFAQREGAVFAATLEVPYAQPRTPLDADLARAYGEGLLRAWARTRWQPAPAKTPAQQVLPPAKP